MQNAKRLLALLLAVLTLTCGLSLPVQATQATRRVYTGGEAESCGLQAAWTFNAADGTLTVSGTGRMDEYDQNASAPWQTIQNSIKKVVIGNGITSVGDRAFYGCAALTAIQLPQSLKSIGSWSFGGCTRLKQVNIPDSVTQIGAYAFGYSEGTEPVPYSGLTLTGGADSAAQRYANAHANVAFKSNEVLPERNPAISAVTLLTDGVKVSWSSVAHAAKYKVYYRNGGNWIAAGTTTGTSYTVGKLTSGKQYSFAVTALSASGKEAAAPQSGKSLLYLSAPVISGLEVQNAGVKVSWKGVSGAARYRVFLKANGSWKALGTTANQYFVAKNLAAGHTYTFTVRCVSADGKHYTSAYRQKGKSILCLSAPVLVKTENTNQGAKLTWKKVSGAAKYRVYYRLGTGSWTRAGDTTGTSYTVKGLRANQKYSFTVRCITADGKQFTSGYNTAGINALYLTAPVLKGTECVNSGVKVSWNASAGVSKYRVFYRTGSGSWKKFTDTTATSVTVTGLSSGAGYKFTVRGISSDGKKYVTDYDRTGVSATYLAPPVLDEVEYTEDGIYIRWKASKGAAKYRVFYRTNGSWTALGDTTDTELYTERLSLETLYSFTVRCISANGRQYTSGYDTKGIRAAALPGQPAVYTFTSAYQSSKFYRQLMALRLGKNPRDNLAEVALTQLGYTEGNRYGQWGGTTGGGNNYTEFGMWYYQNVSTQWDYYAGAWCSMFVSWCANEAGIPSSVIPRRALVEDMDDAFGSRYYTWNETACGYGSKRIQRGDLIIFSASAGGRLSHIAIVTDVTYSGNRCTISTVEGNVDDACRTRRFIMSKGSGGKVDSSHYIRGFCCPAY